MVVLLVSHIDDDWNVNGGRELFCVGLVKIPGKRREESRVKSLTPTEVFSSAHRAGQGENETSSRYSEADKDLRLVLEEQRNQSLSEAKSELLKQECRAERADAIIRELQRQVQSDRMEIGNTNEES